MNPDPPKIPKRPLTPCQKEVLDIFRAFQAKEGMPPTIAEIAQRRDVSRGTTFRTVEALINGGHLVRFGGDRHRPRNIVEAPCT